MDRVISVASGLQCLQGPFVAHQLVPVSVEDGVQVDLGVAPPPTYTKSNSKSNKSAISSEG